MFSVEEGTKQETSTTSLQGQLKVAKAVKIHILVFRVEDEMGRACSTNGENRNAYTILVGKARRK
jgi:hypothetical protein